MKLIAKKNIIDMFFLEYEDITLMQVNEPSQNLESSRCVMGLDFEQNYKNLEIL